MNTGFKHVYGPVPSRRLGRSLGVDALTFHPRFFEDKFKRRSRFELFDWAASLTSLPIIANGDIIGASTLQACASKLTKVSERWLYEQARTDRHFPAVKIGSLVRIQKGEFIRMLVQDGR